MKGAIRVFAGLSDLGNTSIGRRNDVLAKYAGPSAAPELNSMRLIGELVIALAVLGMVLGLIYDGQRYEKRQARAFERRRKRGWV